MDITTDPAPEIRIALIVASVRSPRLADALVPWLQDQLDELGWLHLDVVDLAEVDLPLGGLQPGGADTAISKRLAAADGFLVLVPEYNHSFPAALKNAIDWHFEEWQYKPVGFVGYGAGSGGLRAIEQLRLIFPELRATTIRKAVALSAPWQHIGDDGRFAPPDGPAVALTATITELRWWALSLREGRAAHGVPA